MAADLLVERTADFVKAMTLETGASPMWGAFNCKLGAAMLREAAAMTTQISGEVIPSDKPGLRGDGGCASRPACASASRRGTRR